MLKTVKKLLEDYEVLMLVIMSLFIVAFIVDVQDNPRAGRLFPTYIGYVTLGLIAIEAVVILLKKKRGTPETAAEAPPAEADIADEPPDRLLVVKFVALIALFYGAILTLGYWIATLLFLMACMRVLGIRSKLEIVLVSGGTLAVIYAVFVWGFGFILPTGSLF